MSEVNTDSESASMILSMAQRVHDETIASANETADRIIRKANEESESLTSEAKTIHENAESTAKIAADKAVEDAQEKANSILEAARNDSDELLNSAEKSLSDAENRLTALAGFESEYRASLVKLVTDSASILGLTFTDNTAEEVPEGLPEQKERWETEGGTTKPDKDK